jgi:shikimate kinase
MAAGATRAAWYAGTRSRTDQAIDSSGHTPMLVAMARGHIVLVGAMGSGKTTIGGRLAEALGRPFVDSDEQIAAAFGATGRELAERLGVAWLHEVEASAFTAALDDDDRAVIAAAASIADRPELVKRLRSGDIFVVFLEAELDELIARTEQDDHRRRVDWDHMSDRVGRRRANLVPVADLVVSTTSADPASVLAEVLGALAAQG